MHKFYETVSLFYFLRNQWEQALFKRVPNVVVSGAERRPLHLKLCGSSVRDDDDSNQPQKAHKLHEIKPESHGCYGVCMDETYVH
jgi:hypothetical protein